MRILTLGLTFALLFVSGESHASATSALSKGNETLASQNPCQDPLTLKAATHFSAAEYLERTQGTWTGTAHSVDRLGKANAAPFSGSFSYTYDPTTNRYQQQNEYESPGSSTPIRLNFTGSIVSGMLRIESSSYDNYGSCAWMLDENTMLFYSAKTDFDRSFVETWEIITSLSPTTRTRNAQKIRNGAFDGMIMISETRGAH